MFSKGGSANEGIMHGLERRGYATGSGWENTPPSEWEEIAKTYGMGGTLSTDYTDPENIKKWSEPIDYDFFNWVVSDKVKAKAEKIEQEQIRNLQNINAAKLEGIKTIPEVEKPETRGNELEKIIAKNESLDDKTKNYLKMMAPHMQKRMVADALGAASEAFGKGTGNTGQTIANAISAAAAGMGGSRDIYDKVKMLTLQGEIMKDVEGAKEKKLSNYEFLLKMYNSKNPENKAWATQMMKKDDTSLSDLKGVTSGDWKNWALSENIDNKNFGGFLPENKQGEVIEDVKDKLDPDKFYFDQQNKMYVKLYIENGEKKIKKYLPPKK